MRNRVFGGFVASVVVVGAIAAQTTVKWIVFKSPGAEFSVSFPIAPDSDEKIQPTPEGKVVTHMYSARGESAFFIVGFTDYPVDVQAKREIELDRDNFMKAISAKLVVQKEIKQFGLQGLEFTCRNDASLTATGRIFAERNRRAYIAVYAAFEKTFDAAQGDRFLASLEINPKN